MVQAFGLLVQPAEALGDGLGSELRGVACPSDRELVLSKRKQRSWRESGVRETGTEALASFPAHKRGGLRLREGGPHPLALALGPVTTP